MDPSLYELTALTARTLVLLVLPIIIGTSVGGTLVALLQAAISLPEPALQYAGRLVGLIVVLLLFYSVFGEAFLNLAARVYG